MDENKRGGKRNGAGRKPLPNTQKKTALTLYPTNADLYKFGDKKKMQGEILKFIANYGKETVVQDFNKPTNEIKPYEQPKTNYAVNTAPIISQPLMTQEMVYMQELKKATMISEIQEIVKAAKSDILLSAPAKVRIDVYGKELSNNMYTD